MNFTQLTVFREVMESGSISQTAKKLGRTQPAISHAIKNLEQSLGLSLFERRGRRLVPVPEAQYLLVEATMVLDRLSTISGTMKGLRSAETGSLNVAVMPGPSAFIFPKFISNNIGEDANFQTTISSRSSPQIRELASTQSIDFGFSDFDGQEGKLPQYRSETISSDCFCVLHRDHPLAQAEAVTIADLDGESIGTLHGNHPFPRKLAQAFEQENASYVSPIEAQFFLPLIPFISLGHCCAIVDPLTVVTERELDISRGQVVVVPFDAPIRYEYATLTPLYRPLSQLATRVKESWMESLFTMIDDIGARAELGVP
ncbi:LysR family transcriptional regulator [Litoreibacter halocynthiae]|uniref:LysR family transcriptional regulator n=1 Tax=Litoreibacter halocynthiae TaxID=1242689 RepID=UPI0024934A85|nr:LysR family transcriptional regulator [Litoreibacter halocynthiae]